MSDVLEEVTNAVSKEHVEARLRDWEERIRTLYQSMESWVPTSWHALIEEGAISIHEEMMREVEIPERRLPALILQRDDRTSVRVEPRGLWIIGANGRLHVRAIEKSFFIVDRAENFDAPEWQLVETRNRSRQEKLDASSFRAILE